MFPKTLDHNAQKALATLDNKPFLKPFLLSGGTALALQLGHRVSFDLDFITPKKFNGDRLLDCLVKLPQFTLTEKSWQTIHGTLQKTKISFLYQKSAILKKPLEYQGVQIANLQDIAAMKLAAVSNRGTKRDFIDIYFICQEKDFTLEKLLKLYQQKYQTNGSASFHLLKSLVFFEDADSNPQKLKLIKKVGWGRVKNYFREEITRITDKQSKPRQ